MENMGVDPTFWRGRRVFLTGHTGFKGSWLVVWLQSLGARVTGYALEPPTRPSLFDIARAAEDMNSILGDIRDYRPLHDAISRAEPEIVFHLAAQPLVRYSYQNPVETYSTNVMGTVHLLEVVRRTPSVRAVVVVTSDKCYENREWLWGYREDEAMGGSDPYSSSKGCAELVTASYRKSYFSRELAEGTMPALIASARAGNVIGGGDWADDRLIPDMIRAFGRGNSVTIRNPMATRPWQHVLEPLAGYMVLAQALVNGGGAYAQGWNFGPTEDDARPVQWIVERLAGMWGGDARWEQDRGEHPHEAGCLKLDCSKARTLLGWRPRWDLETALERIVQWHRAFDSGADMRDVTLQQIFEYQG